MQKEYKKVPGKCINVSFYLLQTNEDKVNCMCELDINEEYRLTKYNEPDQTIESFMIKCLVEYIESIRQPIAGLNDAV